MAELRWGAATDTGQVRAGNEDYLFAGSSLFVVADGMGGHQAGEVASQLAVGHLESRLHEDEPAINDLVAAIGQANRDIFESALHDPDRQGMGTTITALAVMRDPQGEEVFALANVGDSRAYLFRHGRLRQLTVDHSYVQELVSEGYITRDEARNHPRRNIVTRALGIDRTVQVDSWAVPIIRGDRFLLCSDGLVDEVHDDEITETLRSIEDPQAAAEDLVRLANEHGGRDNVTLVVVDVLEGDEPPDPTEELDVIPAWGADTGEVEAQFADEDAVTAVEVGEDGEDGMTVTVGGDGPDAPADSVQVDGVAADAPASVGPDPTTPAAVGAPAAVGGLAAAGVATATDVPTSVDDPTATGTATDGSTATDDPTSTVTTTEVPPRTRNRIGRFLTTVAIAAVLVLGFTIFAAWARDGFFVAFDDDETVSIFRGRAGGVLWFDPTLEVRTPFERDRLDETSVALVEQERRFDSLTSAETFVFGRLSTTTTTTTTTTTVVEDPDDDTDDDTVDPDEDTDTGTTSVTRTTTGS